VYNEESMSSADDADVNGTNLRTDMRTMSRRARRVPPTWSIAAS